MRLTSSRGVLAVVAALGVVLSGTAAFAYERPLIGSLSVDIDRQGVQFRMLELLYKQMARGHEAVVLALLDDDVQWKVEGVEGAVPFAGTFSGRRGVHDYFDALRSSVVIDELSLRYVVAQGDTVHLHFYESGVALTTGKAFRMEIVDTWFFSHNRIVKFRQFSDTYAMYEAFDPTAAPARSLVSNDADDGIVPSDYADPLSIAQAQYAALVSVDLAAFLGTLSDDIIWILAGPQDITPIAGTFYGIPGVMDFLGRLFGSEAYLDFGAHYMITDGSRVDSQFYEKILVLKNGRVFTCEGIHTANINHDGKINSFRSINDTYPVAMGHLNN